MDDLSKRRQEFEQVVRKEMNRFRGRLAGAIEGYEFSERQERGLIGLMKTLSYNAEHSIIEAFSKET